jgi:four helix bundle protein
MEEGRSKSIVQDKNFRFAVSIANYVRRQHQSPMMMVLFRQALRSGTSIGANVEEALGGLSRKDFVAKLAIAAKEARETCYWLRLIRETELQVTHGLDDLLSHCNGLVKILNSIILTTRDKTHNARISDNPDPRTQNSEFSGNSELRTQNSEPPH